MKLYFLFLIYLLFFTLNTSHAQLIKLDTSFNHTGYYVFNSNTASKGIAVLPNGDGKYLVKGNSGYFRFTSAGIIDTSFNGVPSLYGQVLMPSVDRFYHKIYKDAQNRIITPYSEGEIRFLATNPDGKTDSTFGINGTRIVPQTFNFSQFDYLTSFLTFQDSSILLASNDKIIKITKRYTVDSSFGLNGIVNAPLGKNFPFNNCATIDKATNKFYILVENRYAQPAPTKTNYQVVRYLPNGTPDPSFGINGFSKLNEDTSLNLNVAGLQLQSNGKILTYGSLAFNNPFIYCHKINGDIDSSFGIFGRLFAPSIGDDGRIAGGCIQKDNKILLINEPSHNIIRFTADGRKDSNFGFAGTYHVPYSQCGFSPAFFLENDTTLMLTGDTAQFCNQSTNITTARFKLKFQPFITGVKSSYCKGSSGIGKVINLPMIGSDTLVTVKLDNQPLSISVLGEFTFNARTVGNHNINVAFQKSGSTWSEIINFKTDSLLIPLITLGDTTTVCNNASAFLLSTNISVYWSGNGLMDNSPDKPASAYAVFNPLNMVEKSTIIATRDNGACGYTSDSLVVKIENIWKGLFNNQWEDSRNWSCSRVPNAIANVIINSGTPFSPLIRSNATCRSLTVKLGAILTIDPNFNLTVIH
jgi:uncharacterized delta-60 repeat protein